MYHRASNHNGPQRTPFATVIICSSINVVCRQVLKEGASTTSYGQGAFREETKFSLEILVSTNIVSIQSNLQSVYTVTTSNQFKFSHQHHLVYF
jgi:hypothetical protein